MKRYHGGCWGCKNQDKFGKSFCNSCQYRKPNWELPNLHSEKESKIEHSKSKLGCIDVSEIRFSLMPELERNFRNYSGGLKMSNENENLKVNAIDRSKAVRMLVWDGCKVDAVEADVILVNPDNFAVVFTVRDSIRTYRYYSSIPKKEKRLMNNEELRELVNNNAQILFELENVRHLMPLEGFDPIDPNGANFRVHNCWQHNSGLKYTLDGGLTINDFYVEVEGGK